MSKEHRPNPIVQMGLFMDGDGIPLAFSINAGNTNEQGTLQPLEEKIISDYQLAKFIVCTDAGLASINNRKFNNINGRAFITTQSIKKLKKFLKEWALDNKNWSLPGKNKIYDISNIDEEVYKDKIFYKERWINEDNINQRLIVTFSIKYRDYQRQIRERQIDRAENAIKSGSAKIRKCNASDYKRFVKKTSCTDNGEIAEKHSFSIDLTVISEEMQYDGFYATCTNLIDEAGSIIEVNKKRWEIEECFRIMKSEFKARPVFLSREDRIKAHFLTCYLSLIVFRFIEKRLSNKYTCAEIIQNLKQMNFFEIKEEGYIPTYTRNDFTDDLHDVFGFRTDYQIMTNRQFKKIIKKTKT
jgi:transposase